MRGFSQTADRPYIYAVLREFHIYQCSFVQAFHSFRSCSRSRKAVIQSIIERGQKAPKLETFVRIANAAGISPEYLLQDSLATLDPGNFVRDALELLTKEQKEIFQNFIIQLAESMK